MIAGMMIVIPPIVLAVVLGPPLLVTWLAIDNIGSWTAVPVTLAAWIAWAALLHRTLEARRNRSKLKP